MAVTARRRRRTAEKPKVARTPSPRASVTVVKKKALVAALQRGASIRDATAFARCTESQYFGWLANDPRFREEATRARSEGVVGALDVILTVGKGQFDAKRKKWIREPDWRALESWLKLVRPDQFGNRLTVHHEQRVEVVLMVVNRLEAAFDAADVPPQLRAAIASSLLEGMEHDKMLEGAAEAID